MLFLFDKATVWEILKWVWGLKWRAASLGEYECTVSVHSSILLNAINVLVYLYEVLLMGFMLSLTDEIRLVEALQISVI